MKRLIAIFLTVVLVLGMFVPMTWASRIEHDVFAAPTDVRWIQEGYKMHWAWDSTCSENFEDFLVTLLYSETELSIDSTDWDMVWTRTYSQYDQVNDLAALADFDVNRPGYYIFTVQAYGEWEETNSETGMKEAHANVSPVSVSSNVLHYVCAEPLAAPVVTNKNGVLTWKNPADVSLIKNYGVKVTGPDASGYEYSYTVNRGNKNQERKWRITTNSLQSGAGDYIVQVRANSNDLSAAGNSDWVTVTITYDGTPITPLPAPTGLTWDSATRTMSWSTDSHESVDHYNVSVYFSETPTMTMDPDEYKEGLENGTLTEEDLEGSLEEFYANSYVGNYDTTEPCLRLPNGDLKEKAGYYFFKVKGYSSNPLRYTDGTTSKLSGPSDLVDGALSLPAPTGAVLDDSGMSWAWDGTAEQQDVHNGFDVELYYAAEKGGTPVLVNTFWARTAQNATNSWERYAEKTGEYSFRVKAHSNDEDLFVSSDWSSVSGTWWYEAPLPIASLSDLEWNGSAISWNMTLAAGLPEDFEEYGQNIELWYYGENGEGEGTYRTTISAEAGSTHAFFTADQITKNGYYKFRVRVFSYDAQYGSNSPWVESEGFFVYQPKAERTALAAPTGLHWDGTTMKWTVPQDRTGLAGYEVQYYAPGNTWTEDQVVQIGQFATLNPRDLNNLGETIHFRVRAISGDLNNYSDSAWEEYTQGTYEKPTLAAPEKLAWGAENAMEWAWDGDDSSLRAYEILLYYTAEKAGTPEAVSPPMTMWDAYVDFDDWGDYAGKDGYYSYKVRAVARNAQYNSSPWSDLSDPKYFDLPEQLKAPSAPRWDGSVATWTASPDEDVRYFGNYMLELYYCGTEDAPLAEPLFVTKATSGDHAFAFGSEDLQEDGLYRFKVRASCPDREQYSNSDPVTSGTFAYTRTTNKLAAPTGLKWDMITAKWDAPANAMIAGYEVQYFVGEDEWITRRRVEPGEFDRLRDWIIEDYTNIGFQVRAISADANQYSDSDWALCSSRYTYPGPQKAVITGLKYNTDTGYVTWDDLGDCIDNYQVEVYYSATEGQLGELVARENAWEPYYLFTEYGSNTGLGYYTYKVKAIGDGLVYTDGDWAQVTHHFDTKIQLGMPTELQWHKEYDRHASVPTDVPGMMSWKRCLDQARYDVNVYDANDTNPDKEPVSSSSWTFSSTTRQTHFSVTDLLLEDLPSGTYYFTVQAVGDENTFIDGPVATSPTWTYTNPGVKLPQLTNVRWDGRNMLWNDPASLEDVRGYHVELYYAQTLYGVKDQFAGFWTDEYESMTELQDRHLMEHGNGYYWFRVRLISNDMTKKTLGPWSAMSGPFNQGAASDTVNDGLQDILDKIKDPDKAVEAVKDMDTEALAAAMAADKSSGAQGDGTLDLIERLENKTGVETKIDTSTMTNNKFDANQVSVVGAALNAAENAEKVTLQIGEPNKNHSGLIGTQYSNTIQFSMHLEGASTAVPKPAQGNQELEVPVRITLPVPGDINPDFLVILHHMVSTDTYVEIRPHLYEENGQWYASFVVTSFCDFIMAAKTMTADAGQNNVTIQLNLQEDKTAAMCAVYDGNGKQLAIKVLTEGELTKGSHQITIECDGSKAKTVKVFYMDENYIPNGTPDTFELKPF